MKKIVYILTILITAFIFNSCDKDESLQLDLSRINFINATPDLITGNSGYFYIDNVLLNTTAVAYKSARGYTSIQSGNRSIKGGYSTASTTALTNLFSKDYSIDANKSYSLFMTGLVGRTTTTPAYSSTSEAILVEDNLVSPATGTFKIRLANMLSVTSGSPTTITLKVKSVNGTTITEVASIASVGAKSVSSFIEVPFTTNGYIFEIQKSSDSSVFIVAGSTTNLTPGRIYTVLASGFETLPTGTGAPASTSLKNTTLITNL